MAIFRFRVNEGYIYAHNWDDVEYVSPRDYVLTQTTQSLILRYLPLIDSCLGKCPLWLFKSLERLLYTRSMLLMATKMYSTKPPMDFYRIINDDLRKNEQCKLLRDCKLYPDQLMSLFVYAGHNGYTISHYSFFEKKCTQDKTLTSYAFKRQSGDIITNMTDLSNEEIEYNLEHKELINAFILDKEDKWFCLCLRKRGLLGKENGERGSKPHMHFISNKFGKKREGLVKDIKNGKCPDSKIHILITDYI